MEKVSIIIPCYNQAHFLHEAIESCLNQTYKNIEIIVVNDGSPDNTIEVASKYKVKLINQKNKGLSCARNTGIKNCTGRYVVTLDSDDKIDPTFISKCIKQKYDIVSTWLQCFGTTNKQWGSTNLRPKYENLIEQNLINCCSFVKREVYDKVLYDENMKDGFEDWDLWIRAAKKGFTFYIIPEYLFFYRKHSVSMFSEAQKKRDEIIKYMKLKYSAKNKLIDVVYVVGSGSQVANNELKFSLRSLVKNVTGVNEVYVIGDPVRWLVNANFIHVQESGVKSIRILNKIKIACENKNITDDFLFMNDDHFFLHRVDAATFPYYYSNEDMEEIINTRIEIDSYVQMIKDTKALFENFNYFDIHTPMIINKAKFLELYGKFNFAKYDNGLLIKSMYCNYFNIPGIAKKDCIFRKPMELKEIEEKVKGHDVFSIHDDAINEDLIYFIESNYPNKTKYE